MNRRKFLNLSFITIITISIPINAKASILDDVKEKINKIKNDMKEHEKYDITFSKMYPKPFFDKSYFSWIIMGTTIIAAGVVSYFTAGAGAPEAAAGVSTIASWIGGGGAGSYMAGLSTIGSFVGGNAMLGAAILNGISLGTIGTSASKITLTLASKIATTIDISMNGFALIKNLKSQQNVYVFDIKIPKDIGSDKVRKLVNKIYNLNDKKQDFLEKKEYNKVNLLKKQLKKYFLFGKKLLKLRLVENKPNIYDLVVLGIIVYKLGNINLYYETLNTIEFLYAKRLKNRSFLDYLWGIYYLSIPNNEQKAFNYFQRSYYEEKSVIEPVLIIIDILGQNYYKNKILISTWVKNAADTYDSNESSGKSLLNLYYKAATISFLNNDWQQAIKYYNNSYDELGLIGRLIGTTDPIKKQIKLYIAICYKHLGNNKQSIKYLNDALYYCKNNIETKEIIKVYDES